MKPLVSVIVPVYKVEECLARCLDSLANQSLTNIEILLIDDASPDKCGEICDAYMEKDMRFRVFHNKTNRGLSIARNIGIEYATSKYLMFVDSDDWVHADFCKNAYESAEHYHADLVLFKFHFVKKNKQFTESVSSDFVQSGLKTKTEAIDFLLVNGNFAWNKLYRKELFLTISYPPNYLYEDIGTTYKLVWMASRIYYLDMVLYYHCLRPGSITMKSTEKSLHDYFVMTLQQCHDIAAWGYPPQKLCKYLQNFSLSYCIHCLGNNTPIGSVEHFRFCENILFNSKGMLPHLTWKRKILFVLFKYCRPLFRALCIYHAK